MTKRIARIAVVAAAAVSFALPAAAAQAQFCLIEEPTIGFFVCV